MGTGVGTGEGVGVESGGSGVALGGILFQFTETEEYLCHLGPARLPLGFQPFLPDAVQEAIPDGPFHSGPGKRGNPVAVGEGMVIAVFFHQREAAVFHKVMIEHDRHLFPGDLSVRVESIACTAGLTMLKRCHRPLENQKT